MRSLRPVTVPAGRLGRSKAGLLVLLVLVGAAIVGAGWWLGSADEGGAAGGAVSVAPVASGESLELAADPQALEERRARGLEILQVPDGIPIPAGVRLPGPGRLVGRVLDRATGELLAGARVDLHPLPPAGAETIRRILDLAAVGEDFESRAEPVAVTGTDVTGNFAFEGLRTGTYFVEARGAWHVPDAPARARVAASGEGGPLDVWVRPGGRVIGRVELPDGRPVAGAKVSITPGPGDVIDSARRGDITFLDTYSDAEGLFVLPGIPPGPQYELAASGRGFALSHLTDLVVQAGEDTRVVLRTRAGATVQGRILSPAELPEEGQESAASRPLAGAFVAVVPRGLRDLSFVSELLEQCTGTTDAEGRYVLRHVPPGELDVIAVAAGHLPAKGPRLFASELGFVSAPDFELPRGPVVQGRVVDSAGEPIPGVAVRWNPVDFRNFQFDFSFAPLLTQAVDGFEYPLTDAEGRFSAGAFPGEAPFRIRFFKVGYEDQRYEWTPEQGDAGGESAEIEVVMTAGGRVEGIVMDGARHQPVTSFTIGGRGLLDAEVDAPGRFNPFSGGYLIEDPKGRFAVDPVRTGTTSLTFRAPGYLLTTVDDLEVAEGQTLRGVIVELQPGGTVRGVVIDEDGVPVAGAQVFSQPSGVDTAARFRERRRERRGPPEAGEVPPGLGAYAASLGLLGDYAVLSGAEGRFELTGVEPGAQVVVASHRDFTMGSSETVLVSADRPAEVEVELTRGGGVYGRASDRFGRPVPGAIVIAVSPANFAGDGGLTSGALYQGFTDAEGEYRIEHMDPGGYFVILTRGDEALNPLSFLGTLNFELVTVPRDEMVEFDLVDTSSGATRVTGVVIARGEEPPQGNLTALGFESESLLGVDVKLAQVRQDGTFEFEGLSPGEYQLQLDGTGPRRAGRRGGGRLSRWVVEIPDVPEHRLELRLPEGGIEGQVVDRSTGEPIPDAQVIARAAERAEPSGWLGRMIQEESGVTRATADADGVFAIERLQAGEYELVVQPPRRGELSERYAPAAPQILVVREDQKLRGVLVELSPALSLGGRVTTADGAPLEDVVLIATRSDVSGVLPARASSDAEGAFTFARLAAGTYDVTASLDGYADTRAQGLELDDEGTDDLELVLHPGIAVSVRVLDADGRPVSGAAGRLVPADESSAPPVADVGRALSNLFSGKGVSGADGRLELGQFGPGEYVLEVQRGLSRAEPQEVVLRPGGDVELRARLR